jgi:hypothetical protein
MLEEQNTTPILETEVPSIEEVAEILPQPGELIEEVAPVKIAVKKTRAKNPTPAEDTSVVHTEAPAPAPELSEHAIKAAVQDKLSKRGEGENPFVPQAQLTEEMKNAAQTAGFELNRGTEIGARLMARANRTTDIV